MSLADIFKSTRFRYSNRQVTKRPFNLLEGTSLEKVPEQDKKPPTGSKSLKKNDTSLQTPAKSDVTSPVQTVETPPPADVSVTFIASTPKVGPQLAKKRRVLVAEDSEQGHRIKSAGSRSRTDRQRSQTHPTSQSTSTCSTIPAHSLSTDCSTKISTAIKESEEYITPTHERGPADSSQKASTATKAKEKQTSSAHHSTPVSWRSRSATSVRLTEQSDLKEPETVSNRRQLQTIGQSDTSGSSSNAHNKKTTDNSSNKVSSIKGASKQTAGKLTNTTKAVNKSSRLKSSVKQAHVKQPDKTIASTKSAKGSSVRGRSSVKESLVRKTDKSNIDVNTETSVTHSPKKKADMHTNVRTSTANKSKKARSVTSTFAEQINETVLREVQRSKTSNNLVQENSSRQLERSKIVKESDSRKIDVNVSTLEPGKSAMDKKQSIDKRIAYKQSLMRKKRLLSQSYDKSDLNISTARVARSQQEIELNEESLLVDQSGTHQEAFKMKARRQTVAKVGRQREDVMEDEEDGSESEDLTVMVLDKGDGRKRRDVLDVDVALSCITEFIKKKSNQCKGMRDRKVLEILEKYIVQDLSTTVFRCQSLRQLQSKIKKHNMGIKEKQKRLFTLQKKRMELEWKCKPLADKQQSSENMTKINNFITDMQTVIAKC